MCVIMSERKVVEKTQVYPHFIASTKGGGKLGSLMQNMNLGSLVFCKIFIFVKRMSNC